MHALLMPSTSHLEETGSLGDTQDPLNAETFHYTTSTKTKIPFANVTADLVRRVFLGGSCAPFQNSHFWSTIYVTMGNKYCPLLSPQRLAQFTCFQAVWLTPKSVSHSFLVIFLDKNNCGTKELAPRYLPGPHGPFPAGAAAFGAQRRAFHVLLSPHAEHVTKCILRLMCNEMCHFQDSCAFF